MTYDPLKTSKPKPRKPPAAAKESGFEGERIAKRMARAGICSRRDAERLITEGRVSVDGKVIKSPALNVTEANSIAVDGQEVAAPAATRLWRYHKPPGIITTARDPQGRPTVFEKLPPELPRVVTVGRLDFNTEGLLLLTNDGGLARHLELPQNAWLRHYRVRVHGDVAPAKLAKLAEGVTISGIHYEPIKAELEKEQGSNAWLNVTIREGKNREVRKIMDYLGLQVTRLIRVSFGPFQLGKLPKGAVEEVPRNVLRTQLANYLKDGR
ncbi:MAG: rRNA pseudouridine synthase [Alphaproteobacteria bacterium]|nr:rRNA pseudouridine synthase [Alphaproteobacteria bacterium]MBV8548819.1 rRNA pseudouridine synthase [Alphaproteobacteria bacterium]